MTHVSAGGGGYTLRILLLLLLSAFATPGLAEEAITSFSSDVTLRADGTVDVIETIVVNAEEKFDVKIPDDEVKNLKTVGDAVTFITSAQV